MSDEYSLRDQVFREFLKNNTLGPTEMTKKLGAKYNSVKAAFSKLAEEGFLQRTSRGDYELNYAGIIMHLLLKIEILEKKVA